MYHFTESPEEFDCDAVHDIAGSNTNNVEGTETVTGGYAFNRQETVMHDRSQVSKSEAYRCSSLFWFMNLLFIDIQRHVLQSYFVWIYKERIMIFNHSSSWWVNGHFYCSVSGLTLFSFSSSTTEWKGSLQIASMSSRVQKRYPCGSDRYQDISSGATYWINVAVIITINRIQSNEKIGFQRISILEFIFLFWSSSLGHWRY